MVPMAYRLAQELAVTDTKKGAEGGGGGKGMEGQEQEQEGDEEEQREGAFRRLETLGYRVGQGVVER